MGIPHDSRQRVKAGLQFALSEASEDGHCSLPEADLIAKAVQLLGVDAVLAEQCLDEPAQEEGVVMEYLPGPRGQGHGGVPRALPSRRGAAGGTCIAARPSRAAS